MNHWLWLVSLVGILSTAVVCGTDMFFLTIGRPALRLASPSAGTEVFLRLFWFLSVIEIFRQLIRWRPEYLRIWFLFFRCLVLRFTQDSEVLFFSLIRLYVGKVFFDTEMKYIAN